LNVVSEWVVPHRNVTADEKKPNGMVMLLIVTAHFSLMFVSPLHSILWSQ